MGKSEVLGERLGTPKQSTLSYNGLLVQLPHIRAGDRALAVDGQPIRNDQDWQTLCANSVPERPEKWEITRDGRQIELLITFPRGFWRGLRGADRLYRPTSRLCRCAKKYSWS